MTGWKRFPVKLIILFWIKWGKNTVVLLIHKATSIYYNKTYCWSIIWNILCFHIDIKFFNERTCCLHLCVRIGIPCFFNDLECCFWYNSFEPTWDMITNVIDFLCILTRSTWAIFVRTILDNFNPATLTCAIKTTFFLQKNSKSLQRLCSK